VVVVSAAVVAVSGAGASGSADGAAQDAPAPWDLGFFDDIVVEADATEERVDLSFRFRERPAIGDVRYEGNGHVSTSDIDEVIDLREGSILSRPAITAPVTPQPEPPAGAGHLPPLLLQLAHRQQLERFLHIAGQHLQE